MLFNLAGFLGGPIFILALVIFLSSCCVEYQYLPASPSEVGAAPYEGAATSSPSKVGKEVGSGWGIIPGVLFLILSGCT